MLNLIILKETIVNRIIGECVYKERHKMIIGPRVLGMAKGCTLWGPTPTCPIHEALLLRVHIGHPQHPSSQEGASNVCFVI
jgi:hypothetical protein